MTGNAEMTIAVIRAALYASDEKKDEALRVFRGEIQEAPKQLIGPLLLGMGAAARLLGVSRATLWRILQSGKIKKVELFPGSFRVNRADLEALAAGKFGLSPNPSKRGRPKKVRQADNCAADLGARLPGE